MKVMRIETRLLTFRSKALDSEKRWPRRRDFRFWGSRHVCVCVCVRACVCLCVYVCVRRSLLCGSHRPRQAKTLCAKMFGVAWAVGSVQRHTGEETVGPKRSSNRCPSPSLSLSLSLPSHTVPSRVACHRHQYLAVDLVSDARGFQHQTPVAGLLLPDTFAAVVHGILSGASFRDEPAGPPRPY